MGREIRRVPLGWEHPRDEYGNHRPLFNESAEQALRTLMDEAQQWLNGTHRRQKDTDPRTLVAFARFNGLISEDDLDTYRPDWNESELTGYCIYETVSEGTPISPVFATLDELADWYAYNGDPVYGAIPPAAAAAFVIQGYAPSGVVVGGTLYSGVEYAEMEG